MDFPWGKKLYTEFCLRKERSRKAWLLAGAWKVKGLRRRDDRGRRPLGLGEKDVKQVLLDCLEPRNYGIKLLNKNG